MMGVTGRGADCFVLSAILSPIVVLHQRTFLRVTNIFIVFITLGYLNSQAFKHIR